MRKKLWMLWCGMILCCVMFAVNVSAAAWDGTAASGFAGGTGTENDPYQIATAEQLAYLAESVNSGTTYERQYIKLTADIVLNDTTAENWMSTAKKWTPIGTYTDDTVNAPFSGTFDGGNHTISGMYIYALNGTTWLSHQGLFGYTYNAEFKDVTIVDADITGADNVGTLVGYAYYYTEYTDAEYTISGCTVKDTKLVGENNTGGLTGQVYSMALGEYRANITISINFASCANENSSVRGESYVGGLMGGEKWNNSYAQTYTTFTDCTNSGNISSSSSASSYAGGIAGRCYGVTTFTDCTNSGNISSSSSDYTYAGGIVGCCSGTVTITKCMNKGAVSTTTSSTFGKPYVGGIVGYCSDTVTFKECTNSGDVTSSSYSYYSIYAGGIVGFCYSTAMITECTNKGDISSTITTPSSSPETYVGGIVGYCYSITTITECTNRGNIASSSPTYNSNFYAGGIAGYCRTVTFTECTNSGEVSSLDLSASSSTYAGGIVGFCYTASFTDCTNSGTVSSSSSSPYSSDYTYAGGIAGRCTAGSTIENCFNTGSITSSPKKISRNSNVGGIVGYAEKSVVHNCYNIGSSSGRNNVGGIVGYLLGGESKAEAFVYNCYNLGSVNGMKYDDSTPASYIGAVIGQTSGQVHVASCYYLECCASDDLGNIQNSIGSEDCTAPTADIAGMAVSCTDDQMQQQSTYAGFDFNEIWTMGDTDYPYPVFRTPEEVVPTIFGDVNNSGETDTEDSRILAQYFAGYDVGEEFVNQDAADVNGDGMFTRADAMILSRHLAGWSGYETLPVKD